MAAFEVIHNKENDRFEVHFGVLMAELDYMLRKDLIIFTHTGVPEPLEGQGIGSALARAGLDYAREAGLTVRPHCPFVRSYIEAHAEYQDLVKK